MGGFVGGLGVAKWAGLGDVGVGWLSGWAGVSWVEVGWVASLFLVWEEVVGIKRDKKNLKSFQL